MAAILFIDDEEVIRDFFRAAMESRGHRVVCESSAAVALSRLGTSEVFDLIVCDIRMPGLDGRAFHERLLAIRPEAVPRLLFVSGDILNPEIERFLGRTGVPYLKKPFCLRDLFAMVDARVGAPA